MQILTTRCIVCPVFHQLNIVLSHPLSVDLNYQLVGLQIHVSFHTSRQRNAVNSISGPGTDENLRKRLFLSMLEWAEDEIGTNIVGGSANRVVRSHFSCQSFSANIAKNATHPITNLTISHTEGIMAHFYNQTIPPRRIKMPRKGGSS